MKKTISGFFAHLYVFISDFCRFQVHFGVATIFDHQNGRDWWTLAKGGAFARGTAGPAFAGGTAASGGVARPPTPITARCVISYECMFLGFLATSLEGYCGQPAPGTGGSSPATWGGAPGRSPPFGEGV